MKFLEPDMSKRAGTVTVERSALLPRDPSLRASLHTILALDDVFHRRERRAEYYDDPRCRKAMELTLSSEPSSRRRVGRSGVGEGSRAYEVN